ncbi:MAG: hypothetical protein JWO98_3776 [Frankiales bacterium]|nr:hypothetical protein [Frankiales bacterium]
MPQPHQFGQTVSRNPRVRDSHRLASGRLRSVANSADVVGPVMTHGPATVIGDE